MFINLSNHPSTSWTKEQRAGLGEITDIPFPNIDPRFTTQQVEELAEYYCKMLHDIGGSRLMMQGEFSFCYILQTKLMGDFLLYVPTTERVSVTNIVNGVEVKSTVFSFVQWRKI